MKKIVIALILVISLSVTFCACNSHTEKTKEGTSSEVSSDVSENGGTTEKPTLEVVDSEGEITIPLEEFTESTTKSSGKETTKKNSETTTSSESTTRGSYEMPVIPIP